MMLHRLLNFTRLDQETPDTIVDAALDVLAAAGLVIVPREPTAEMLHASTSLAPTWDDEASKRKWQAMIDAALPDSHPQAER